MKKKMSWGLVLLGCFCILAFMPEKGHAITKIAASELKLDWYSYSDAMKAASSSNALQQKYVVLFFTGSDWCIWCKKLEKELLDAPEFIEYASKKLLMVKVDFPANTDLVPPAEALINHGLKKLYGIRGYPTLIFLDSKGRVVAQEGYLPGGSAAYLAHLQQKLD